MYIWMAGKSFHDHLPEAQENSVTPIMLALVVRYEASAGAPTIITMSLGGST